MHDPGSDLSFVIFVLLLVDFEEQILVVPDYLHYAFQGFINMGALLGENRDESAGLMLIKLILLANAV